MGARDTADRLLGTWTLVAMEARRASGEVFLPWGPSVRGRLTYDGSGHVALQLSKPGRVRFASEDLEAGTPAEVQGAFDGYHAWFGRFTVGPEGDVVVHHIEASLFPNWEGQDQTRLVFLDENTLVLRSRALPYGGESVEFSTRWTRAKVPDRERLSAALYSPGRHKEAPMPMPESRPSVRELVLVPAIITLAVTALRLVGELQHWNERFFSRAPGGPGAIVGIVWLVFVFGAWFAVKLARAGEGPAGLGRVFGFWVLGVLVAAAFIGVAVAAKLGQSIAGASLIFLGLLAGGVVASRGWPALGKVLFVYALAARVPVAALMLPAIMGHWGTHYDAMPPNLQSMDPVKAWAFIGLFPQLTLWVGFTLIGGMLAGAIAAAAVGGRRREAVASAA